ncbi:unnamed protein product [Ambrosiozyma monospora]|uniref:Unnamed protein product n=1 Tax=Ambrosiozyma monospora TaxID=43982 RepID=A0ACB5U507_AMBMO|nr:unnamed protein product [Ambrosiozyma monospora]
MKTTHKPCKATNSNEITMLRRGITANPLLRQYTRNFSQCCQLIRPQYARVIHPATSSRSRTIHTKPTSQESHDTTKSTPKHIIPPDPITELNGLETRTNETNKIHTDDTIPNDDEPFLQVRKLRSDPTASPFANWNLNSSSQIINQDEDELNITMDDQPDYDDSTTLNLLDLMGETKHNSTGRRSGSRRQQLQDAYSPWLGDLELCDNDGGDGSEDDLLFLSDSESSALSGPLSSSGQYLSLPNDNNSSVVGLITDGKNKSNNRIGYEEEEDVNVTKLISRLRKIATIPPTSMGGVTSNGLDLKKVRYRSKFEKLTGDETIVQYVEKLFWKHDVMLDRPIVKSDRPFYWNLLGLDSEKDEEKYVGSVKVDDGKMKVNSGKGNQDKIKNGEFHLVHLQTDSFQLWYTNNKFERIYIHLLTTVNTA